MSEQAKLDLLTLRQAAEYQPALGLRYITRLADEHRIPVVKIGRRRFLARQDLDELIAKSRLEAIR